MQRFIAMCACALVLAAGFFLQVQAGVPLVISHQGRLLDASDQPVNGTVPITFRLYDASSGGALLWTESYPSVVVTNGLFDVKLGSITPLTLDLLSPPSTGVAIDRYLDVAVSGTSLTPRMRLACVPYAMSSGRMTGDVETAPGEMRLGGMSGSTTATIRASNSGTPGSTLDLVDSSGSSVIRYTAIATFSDGSSSDMTVDDNGDGTPESSLKFQARSKQSEAKSNTKAMFTAQGRMYSDTASSGLESTLDTDNDGVAECSIRQKTTAAGSLSTLQGRSGSTTGTIRMMATPDSTDSYWFADSDADGLYDGDVHVRLRPRDGLGHGAAALSLSTDRFANGPRQTVSMDGSFARSQVRCATDFDLDGIPDVVVAGYSGADSAGVDLFHKSGPGHVTLRSGHSGSTTGTIRMSSSLDSTGEVVDHDSDGDGHSDSKFTITARDQYGNCQLATDTDDDGVADNSSELQCDAIESRVILKGRSGSTTGTIRMGASGGGGPILPECVSAVEMDTDGDGHADRGTRCVSDASAATCGSYADTDDDGVSDNDVEMTADATGSVARLGGRSGSTTGTIRMAASGGGGVGLSPECVLAMQMEEPGDSHRSKWIQLESNQLGHSRMQIATDTDDDGVANQSIEGDCDDTDARLVVSNIGSSGQDGVAIQCSPSSRSITLGPNLGSSGQDGVAIEMDASSRRFSIGSNIGSSGQDGIKMEIGAASHRFSLGNNIGSSGQDGVSMEVTSSLHRFAVGNIGSSGQDGVSIEMDATSRRLTVGNIGSSGNDGVSVDVRSSGSKLVVHNIGSSGQDGVSILDDGSGGRIGVDTIPTTHKISIGGGGAYCDGTDWVNGSDVNTKENFEEVSGEEILDKIGALSITQWNFKKDGEAVKHIGPTAQDFKAAFGVGASDKAISTIDPSGIALAAIKALQKQNQYLQVENEQLREALENLNRKVDKLAASR